MNSSTDISRSTRRTEQRRQPAFKVGLTGGIASGKSTVAGLFGVLGVPCIDTDQIARDVVQPGSDVLAAIVARFGPQVLQADGSLDRRQLRTRVFADDRARADLEALTHPAIAAETELRSKTARGPYLLIAVPLLAEKQLSHRYDRVLVIDCDPSLQWQRLTLRDRISPQQAQAMLAAQASREQRLAIADDILVNNGSLTELVPQVEALHRRYLQLANLPRTG